MKICTEQKIVAFNKLSLFFIHGNLQFTVKERVAIFIQWLKGYISLVFTLLLVLSLVRLLWLFNYGNLSALFNKDSDLFSAFLLGFRFDFSDVCYFSAPGFILTLLWIIAGPSYPSRTLYRSYIHFWVFWIVLLLLIASIDFKYYSFFQDHINILIFGFFEDDTTALLKTFWQNYPVILIFTSIVFAYLFTYKLLVSFFWSEKKLFETSCALKPTSESTPRFFKWSFHITPFVVFVSLVLGARGSFGLFPLEIMHTAISKNQFINVLAFNGPHALARAIQLKVQQKGSWNEGLKNFGYADQPEKALADFLQKNIDEIPKVNPLNVLQRNTIANNNLEQNPPHVVFVLMESMGTDWLNRHDEKNLNLLGALAKHFQNDFLFKNFMPASAATIGSLGTLLTNMPPQFMAPFLTDSVFMQVTFSTASARQFQKKNYETHFIYGGNLGWRNLAKFVPQQGFDYLHGEVEIGEIIKDTEKHDWGIYDEYVFSYVEKLLTSAKKPQFIFLLTTTNHPPYTLPKNYKALPLKISPQIKNQWIGDPTLNEKRLIAYQYGNHQLGLFLDQIKSSPLKDNTIIAASGDHSFYILPYAQDQISEKWGVPFYLYLPENYYPKAYTKIDLLDAQKNFGSHIDIFPTLYHLALSDLTYTSLGKNLFAKDIDHWAIHAPSQSIFNEKGLVFVHSKNQAAGFKWDQNHKLIPTDLNSVLESAKIHYSSFFGITDLLFYNEKNKQNKVTK